MDIIGRTKGKGFMGAMKRWNFKGQPASHGTSLAHRSLGGMGGCQDPGRVFKGKRMAGRGGNKNRVNECLELVKIDYARSLLFVRGSVNGMPGKLLKIRDAYRAGMKHDNILNFPTFKYEKGKEYANIIENEATKDDPTEYWLHENAVVKDDEDDGGEE